MTFIVNFTTDLTNYFIRQGKLSVELKVDVNWDAFT